MVLSKFIKGKIDDWKSRREKRVKRIDLEESIRKIKDSADIVSNDITRLIKEIQTVDKSTEEGKAQYKALKEELSDKTELYSVLQKEIEDDYTTLKKLRDAGPIDTILKVGGITSSIILTIIGIAADRDSPRSLKIITYVQKLLPTNKNNS